MTAPSPSAAPAPDLDVSVAAIRALALRMPVEFRGEIDGLCQQLLRLRAVTELDAVHVVRATSARWLPDTLNSWLAIPEAARTATAATGQNPADELRAALDALSRRLSELETAEVAAARSQLAAQTRFIRDVTAGSALNLATPQKAMTEDPAATPIAAICGAYAEVLRDRRENCHSLVDWTTSAGRGFPSGVVIGSPGEPETVITTGRDAVIAPTHSAHARLVAVTEAVTANSYTAEAVYGYGLLSGSVADVHVRAPLLLLPVSLSADASGIRITPTDHRPRLNVALLAAIGAGIDQAALAKVAAAVPLVPAAAAARSAFAAAVAALLPSASVAAFDGVFDRVVTTRAAHTLTLVDQAVILMLPRTSFFLASDLDSMAKGAALSGPVRTLLGLDAAANTAEAGIAQQVEPCLPFASNEAQRHVVSALADPAHRVVRIDGPPGTGKSLTIANVVCDLVASGKTVLVSSMRDAAIEVVDRQLRTLNSDAVPMTLLSSDHRSAARRMRNAEPSTDVRTLQATTQRLRQELASLGRERDATRKTINNAVAAECIRQSADHAATLQPGVGSRLRRRMARLRAWRLEHRLPSEVAPRVADITRRLRDTSHALVSAAVALRLTEASAADQAVRREFAHAAGRSDDASHYALFEELRSDPGRAAALLRLLPVWLMSPDDAARLFPCVSEMFDVVIVDEASQVDLPSVLPVLQRGRQAVISGDAAQMQPKRFSFVSSASIDEVWRQSNVATVDPQGLLHPLHSSLIELAQQRTDSAVLLNEHFRSMPPLIAFSNRRWYDGRLRVMTDASNKRFGAAGAPTMALHRVPGTVETGGQINAAEAAYIITLLQWLFANPAYASATVAVVALFDDQATYLQTEITKALGAGDPERRLLIGLADQLQGDERDVTIHSLSFDAKGMTQAQLSPRMSAHPHVQGMLNVMMTRARDEIHIVHSVPPSAFTFSDGTASALSEWLEHATRIAGGAVTQRGEDPSVAAAPLAAEVATALRQAGCSVEAGPLVCGLALPVVYTAPGGHAVALEVDGDRDPRLADPGPDPFDRVEILGRGGWRTERTGWSEWRRQREAVVRRLVAASVMPGGAR